MKNEKKIFLLLLLFGVFIMLSSNISGQLYEFDFNNLNQSKIKEINYSKTTAFTDFALKIAHTGFEYLCHYRNQGYNSTGNPAGQGEGLDGTRCFDGSGNYEVNSPAFPPLLGNRSFSLQSAQGTDSIFTGNRGNTTDGIFDTGESGGMKAYVITTDETHSVGESQSWIVIKHRLNNPSGNIMIGNPAGQGEGVEEYIQIFVINDTYNGWTDSTIKHSDDNNTLIFFSIESVNDIIYISNFSDSYSYNLNPVDSTIFQIRLYGGSVRSHGHRFDELFVVNSTPNYDETANYIEWTRITIPEPNNIYKLWYYGSPSGVALNMSCNNGTTWTGTYSNYSDISCPNGQLTQDIFIGATFNTTNANLTSIFLDTSFDNQQPNITMALNDTSLAFDDSVNITGYITDNLGLSFCQITTNQTGATQFFNYSLAGLSDECSQNFTISASTNTIVNFSIIVNDTFSNNIRQTSQSVTIGDVTAPFIGNITLNKTTLTTSETNVFSFRCEDTDGIIGQSFLNRMNFTVRRGNTNLTRILRFLPQGETTTSEEEFSLTLDTKSYIWNYTLFESIETPIVDTWNITDTGCQDRADNYFGNDSVNLLFNITAVPSAPSDGGGGGGGGQPAPSIEYEERVEIAGQCNFNAVCEPDFGEDFINCPDDCEFATAGLNPLCMFRPVAGEQCIYRTGLFARLTIILALLSGLIIVSDTTQGVKIRKWVQKNLNLNLLKE